MKMTCIAKCIAINKKTKAKMFSNVQKGDIIRFSVPIKPVGGNRGRSYAVKIDCTNERTKESALFTFNEIGNILDCFGFMQRNLQ